MKETLSKFLISLLVFSSLITKSQLSDQLSPPDIFSYQFLNNNFTEEGCFLSTPTKLYVKPKASNYINPYATIIDQNGELVWYLKSDYRNVVDFKYYPESNIYSYVYKNFSGFATKILDEDLNPIDTLYTQDALQDIHDIQLAKNGNWLISTAYFDTTDMSMHTFNGSPGNDTTVLVGYGVQEFSPNGTKVFEWNSNDHINPTEFYDFYNYTAFDFDYCHGNAVEEDFDGHLLFSFRHLNAIHKVHRTTGEIIWRLGGKASDFTFVNDTGFSAQHDIRLLDNGNYSLFDNGNMQGEPNTTRGLDYKLDTNHWTATLIEEVTYPSQLYARAMGSFQRLNNFDVFGYGFVRRPSPSFAVFDKSNVVLAELHFLDSVVTYRTKFYTPPLPERKEITCEFNGANWILKGPDGENDYKWSTGDTTSSIALNSPGTYQVWTSHGDGYLGSKIFTVTDINNPCNSTNLSKITGKDKSTYYWCDLLGRKVYKLEKNTVYLKVYETGKTEKVIFTTNQSLKANR